MFFNKNKPKLKRPTRNFDEFFEHIKSLGFNPGTVIDVGAARGTPSLHNAFKHTYFVLFEPLSSFVPQLKKMMLNYKGEIHNCALGTTDKEGTILRSKDSFGSSIMHSISNDSDSRLEKIQIKTLDGVFRDRNLPKPYLLKTDCQGGDFNVVKSGMGVMIRSGV